MRALFFVILIISMNSLLATQETVDLKKCVSYVKSKCSSKNYETCLKSLSKDQATQVNKCVNFMTKSKNKIDVSQLDSSFKAVIAPSGQDSSENQKCYEISKQVCGEEDLSSCMKKNIGKFPSYCKQAAFEGMDNLKSLYKNNRKVGMCAEVLAAQCNFNIPEAKEKPDPEKYKKALADYQSCVQSKVAAVKECKDFTKDSKEQAIQLIQ